MSTPREPVPFEAYADGIFLHGTKADLVVGDLLVPGRESNFEESRVMNYVYFTGTPDAATWGAHLASGSRSTAPPLPGHAIRRRPQVSWGEGVAAAACVGAGEDPRSSVLGPRSSGGRPHRTQRAGPVR